MYIVRFVRADGRPNENYYYHNLKDAIFHFTLFKEDDSGLYLKIELIEDAENTNSCFFSNNDVEYQIEV